MFVCWSSRPMHKQAKPSMLGFREAQYRYKRMQGQLSKPPACTHVGPVNVFCFRRYDIMHAFHNPSSCYTLQPSCQAALTSRPPPGQTSHGRKPFRGSAVPTGLSSPAAGMQGAVAPAQPPTRGSFLPSPARPVMHPCRTFCLPPALQRVRSRARRCLTHVQDRWAPAIKQKPNKMREKKPQENPPRPWRRTP